MIARWRRVGQAIGQRARSLRADSLALFFALADPRMPRAARWLVWGIVAYALSPIDLIPDFIPVIGFLDELILLPLAIAFAIRWIPAPVMADARARAAAQPQRVKLLAGAVLIGLVWLGLGVLVAWYCLG